MNQACTVHDSTCVLQITDTHLLADPDGRLGEWNTQAALDAVLADVRRIHPRPNALLLSGDLVHDESAAGYRRLAHILLDFDVPVFAIPGNHDDADAMVRCMPDIQSGGSVRLGGWHLHLLDSRIPGSDGGRLGAEQRLRLSAALDDAPGPTLIAVHHPPAPVGSAWLDAMRLADADALLRMAAAHAGTRAIVCGHVHQAFDDVTTGVRQLTTPATCRQFAPDSPEPAEDRHNVPGYRCLHLGRDGRLTTRVHRVPAARDAGLAHSRG